MKIIYGTDFSPSTVEAGKLAAALARKLGDTLVVAHVVDPPTVFSPEISLAETSVMQDLISKAGERIKTAADELREVAGLEPEARSLMGAPDEELADLAEREDARLVVVGSHGRTALGRLFVGTVAERLVRRCRRPVLVVPAGREHLRHRLEPARPLKLTVALERGEASAAALEFVRALQAVTRCDVTFVHVFSPSHERARLGIESAWDPHEADPDVVAILERDLRPLIAGFPNAESAVLRIRARRAGEPDPVGWAAALDDADLLVVGGSPAATGRPPALDSIRSGLVPVISIAAPTIEKAEEERPLAPWRSVLAATDLSPEANAAVAAAYRLLAGVGGTVELCLVQDPELHPHAPERWVDLQKELWKLVPSAAERQGIVTRTSIVEGRIAAEKILQAAERLGVDALVLGAGHRSGLARALIGSVSDGVARSSSKPVVLVPAPAAGPARSR